MELLMRAQIVWFFAATRVPGSGWVVEAAVDTGSVLAGWALVVWLEDPERVCKPLALLLLIKFVIIKSPISCQGQDEEPKENILGPAG